LAAGPAGEHQSLSQTSCSTCCCQITFHGPPILILCPTNLRTDIPVKISSLLVSLEMSKAIYQEAQESEICTHSLNRDWGPKSMRRWRKSRVLTTPTEISKSLKGTAKYCTVHHKYHRDRGEASARLPVALWFHMFLHRVLFS
jgi:hypothetical protein